MSIPRELTNEERILICHGLAKERLSIEQAIRKDFELYLEKRNDNFTETRMAKLKMIDNLYKVIGQDVSDLGIWLYDPKEEKITREEIKQNE